MSPKELLYIQDADSSRRVVDYIESQLEAFRNREGLK